MVLISYAVLEIKRFEVVNKWEKLGFMKFWRAVTLARNVSGQKWQNGPEIW